LRRRTLWQTRAIISEKHAASFFMFGTFLRNIDRTNPVLHYVINNCIHHRYFNVSSFKIGRYVDVANLYIFTKKSVHH